jgi:hypothetical protein
MDGQMVMMVLSELQVGRRVLVPLLGRTHPGCFAGLFTFIVILAIQDGRLAGVTLLSS